MENHESILSGVSFPPIGTSFYMEDYLQVDVDDFESDNFVLLGVEIKKTKMPKYECKSVSKYIWVIKTKRLSDNMIVFFLSCGYESLGNWRMAQDHILRCNEPSRPKNSQSVFFRCSSGDFIESMKF
jgi:hypothetical protein